MSEHLPLTVDVDEVTFSRSKTGEWEIKMVREGQDDLYHYTDRPDGLYDQLIESGDIDTV